MRPLLFILFMALCMSCSTKKEVVLTKPHLCTMFVTTPTTPRIEAIGDEAYLWPKKRVEVYFFDDEENIKQQVLQIANEWQPYSGIRFVATTNRNQSDIRISFKTGGWWSQIGTCADQIPKDSVTMSLNDLHSYPTETFKSVILHEFGHSLGLLHEHQHPFLEIKWNLDSLYSYYKRTFKVDSTWVKNHVLEKKTISSAIYCEPDKNSIMMYAIPPGLTLDGLVVNEPLDLSPLDKKCINYMYTHKKFDN